MSGFNLTIEQQFKIQAFQLQAAQMSEEQAKVFLKELYVQMIVQQNSYKSLLSHKWANLDSVEEG